MTGKLTEEATARLTLGDLAGIKEFLGREDDAGFLECADQYRDVMHQKVTGDWPLDYLLFRIVLSRFRGGGADKYPFRMGLQRTTRLIEGLLERGGRVPSLRRGFRDALVGDESRWGGVNKWGCFTLEDRIGILSFLSARGLKGRADLKRYAGYVLASALKDAWMVKDDITTTSPFEDERDVLTTLRVHQLMELGADTSSMAPPWHRERNTVAEYASSLDDPEISAALHGQC